MIQVSKSGVQERLIKNKSLLNVVEPAMTNSYLAGLIQALEWRISYDKDVLFNFCELKKDVGEVPANPVVAPLFKQFAQGYTKAITLMKDDASHEADRNGYHSNSDEDDATSKNSNWSMTTVSGRSTLIRAVVPIEHFLLRR